MKFRSLALVFLFFFSTGSLYAQTQVSIRRPEAKKVDIVLLQDESGSMDRNDPHHIRKHVATFLIEELEVAGKGNRMALALFGTRAERRVGLSRDFKTIMIESERGFPPHAGPIDLRSPEGVPPRFFTDIFGALNAALQILSAEEEGITSTAGLPEKQKHVILLTDGKMDPWPGNSQRYGSLSGEYLECLERSNHRECNLRFRDRVAKNDKEYLFDRSGILSTFKRNGWRVHCVGFSGGVDGTLLNSISAATYGHAGVAEDYTQLLSILEQIIPQAPNVVTLLLRDFCDTRRVEETINIDRDIKAVQFKVDLNRMLAEQAYIRPNNLQIVLTDPQGRQISSQMDEFRFNTTRDGLVVTASYFKERPAPGQWRALIEGIGTDICGKIKVTGKVPFVADMDFAPEMDTYFGNQEIDISVSLKNEEDNQEVSIRSATGVFRYSSSDAEMAIIEERNIEFELSEGGASAISRFRIPRNIKGTAAIETTIVDERYKSKTKSFRQIEIAADPSRVVINAQPSEINLGIVGDDTYDVEISPIRLSTQSPIPFSVNCNKPNLKMRGNEIPITWVTVSPSKGEISPNEALDISIRVSLPDDVSLNFPQGIYKGNLEVNSTMYEGSLTIPVDLEVNVPEIIVEPLKLKTYDFWWRIGTPKTQKIEIGHTSNRDRELKIELPKFIRNSSGRNEPDIQIKVKDIKEDPLKRHLDTREIAEVPLQVVIKNLKLNKSYKIRKGIYTGKVRVFGEGLNPETIDIKIKIPDLPWVVKYGRTFSFYTACLFALLTILGTGFFFYRRFKNLFEREYEVNFSKMSSQDQLKRFGCVFQRKRDSDGGFIVSMPSGLNNPSILNVQDPDSSEYIPFPIEGISNIDDWKGERLGKIKVGNYVYRLRSRSKKLILTVKQSPYKTIGFYFSKKVLPWLVLGLAFTVLTYWFYQIV